MLVSSFTCQLLPRCRADFWLFLLPFVLVQSIGSGLYIANLSLLLGFFLDLSKLQERIGLEPKSVRRPQKLRVACKTSHLKQEWLL